MNKEKLTWGQNDDKSCLGPFRSLCVAGVGSSVEPKNSVSCEIRIKILTNDDFVDDGGSLIDVRHLPRPVTGIPVNTRDTAKTGTVCHRYGISATVPVPVKPAA